METYLQKVQVLRRLLILYEMIFGSELIKYEIMGVTGGQFGGEIPYQGACRTEGN